jgi:K+-sensing histidine kinase KdpD
MFSPISTTDIINRSHNCDILQIINDFCLTYEQNLSDRDLLLSTRIDTDIPQLLIGDPLLITQLLHDLSEYSLQQDARGCVVLDLKAEQENEKSYFIYITVTMSGKGIPMAKEKNLFSDKKTAGKADVATLYYARKISRFYDGDILVKNSIGFGTRFMVKIRLFCMDEY